MKILEVIVKEFLNTVRNKHGFSVCVSAIFFPRPIHRCLHKAGTHVVVEALPINTEHIHIN